MSEKVYSRVTEAEEMIRELCGKYPEALWCVRPQMVTVLGIENKERAEKNTTLAKIKPIKGCEKAILQDNNIPTRYIIEIYWSDWREWKETKRQWIMFHELIHIHSEVGKTIKHDCEDFKIVLDKVGVNWITSETLPNLLNEKVEFNLDLRPSMEDAEEENDEINEEIEKKKRGRPKKEVAKEESVEVIKKDNPELDSDNVKKDGEEDPDGDVFV
jgi:predicted metallopeptidase